MVANALSLLKNPKTTLVSVRQRPTTHVNIYDSKYFKFQCINMSRKKQGYTATHKEMSIHTCR